MMNTIEVVWRDHHAAPVVGRLVHCPAGAQPAAIRRGRSYWLVAVGSAECAVMLPVPFSHPAHLKPTNAAVVRVMNVNNTLRGAEVSETASTFTADPPPGAGWMPGPAPSITEGHLHHWRRVRNWKVLTATTSALPPERRAALNLAENNR